MAHNVGQVVQLLPSHSRKNSVSSNYSRSSCSSYSETSSSNGSDYIFGSDIFFGNEFGAFPTTAESEHGAFPSAPSDSHRASNNTRNDTESILQKSAMAAFIASPNSSRWGDLVRTMRVENRIKKWAFISLHDDIDKIVEDCGKRNDAEHDVCQKTDKYDAIDLKKTYSKETEATTSSSSRSGTPDTWGNESGPSDESFTFEANFLELEGARKDSTNRGTESYAVKLPLIQFLRDPNSPSAWDELVASLREEKARETTLCAAHIEDPQEEEYSAAETDSESGWANFDDISITNHRNIVVEHDHDFNVKCQQNAMSAFLQQPSQDKWTDLVESIRQERRKSDLNCPTSIRRDSRLEKLEEEASAAETESKESSSIGRSLTPHECTAWQHFDNLRSTKNVPAQKNRVPLDVFEDNGDFHYAV